MHETTVDGWNQGRTNAPEDVQNSCWRMRQVKESIPNDVRNNCWWMRPIKYCSYEMMYKTAVDGCDRWRTTHTRWCSKQLLMEEKDKESMPNDVRNNCWWLSWRKGYPYEMMNETVADGRYRWRIQTRWCRKQLLMDEPNEGLSIPEDVPNNWSWVRQNRESIPDDVRNDCWWMRPTMDHQYQTMCKTTVGGWDRWRNPCQMMYEKTVE